MADNPYAPPRAPVPSARPPRARPLAIAAIIGALVDFFGTFAFGLAASFVVAGLTAAGGGGEAEIRASLETGGWQAFSVAAGAVFTGIGGYVAARLAIGREYTAALAVGVLAILIGETMVALTDGYEVWMRIAGDLVAIPAALFGGWVRKVQGR